MIINKTGLGFMLSVVKVAARRSELGSCGIVCPFKSWMETQVNSKLLLAPQYEPSEDIYKNKQLSISGKTFTNGCGFILKPKVTKRI